MVEETFGQCVRRLILQKSLDEGIKYTDADIARVSEISTPVLSRIVNDEPNYYPTARTLMNLAMGLDKKRIEEKKEPKYGPELLGKWLKMNGELVDLWKVQDTPAGKAAINQAHDYYKQASGGGQGSAVYINARS